MAGKPVVAEANDFTAWPGRQCDRESTSSIVQALDQDFGFQRKGNRPRWSDADSLSRIRTYDSPDDIEIAGHLDDDACSVLFFYIEGGDRLQETCRDEIVDYFERVEPWEDHDIYMFPPTRAWVLVVTHEQMDGVHLLRGAASVLDL